MSDARRLDPATLRLVAIVDTIGDDGVEGVVARALGAVAGGATMLQLRLKDESAHLLVEVARRLVAVAGEVPVLVSSRADVAIAAGAAGVHLGLDDLAATALRPIVPPRFVIGASVAGAGEPIPPDADYIAIGPVFGGAESLGVDRLGRIVRRSAAPVLAVGGVAPEHVRAVLAAGAAGVAVLTGFPGGPGPTTRVRALRDALDASGR